MKVLSIKIERIYFIVRSVYVAFRTTAGINFILDFSNFFIIYL